MEPLSTTIGRTPGGIRPSTQPSASASLRHGRMTSTAGGAAPTMLRRYGRPPPAGQRRIAFDSLTPSSRTARRCSHHNARCLG